MRVITTMLLMVVAVAAAGTSGYAKGVPTAGPQSKGASSSGDHPKPKCTRTR